MRRGLHADVVGRGPAVVLLHGQPGSSADWRLVAPKLADEFTVIAPDRPGYGRTGGAATGFAGNAQALADLLNQTSTGPAIVVGHSWAGGVAIAFAEMFPHLVTGLVLASSIAPGEEVAWSDRLLAAPIIGEAVSAMTIGATGRLLASRRFQSVADRRLGTRAREAVAVLANLTGARSGAEVWRSFVVEQRALLGELDTLGPALSRLRVPTEVLHGSADHVVLPAAALRLAAAIPGATRSLLGGANHLLPLLHPDAIAGAVREVAARASNGLV